MSKPLCITMRLGGAISLAGEQSHWQESNQPPAFPRPRVACLWLWWQLLGRSPSHSLPPVGNQEPRPLGGSRR